MVFDRRPDEMFSDMLQQALTTFKDAVGNITGAIRSGDETLRDMDDALTGGRPRVVETPQETFGNILEQLEAAIAEARDKGSAAAPSVAQRAREILGRINTVEPAWRPGPASLTRPGDVFRAALRDLRASNSLIRLAQGNGTLEDLEGLSKWAGDLSDRINQIKAPQPAASAPSTVETSPRKAQPKKPKKDTTPKAVPADADVVFARAVAAEMNDEKVTGWAEEFAKGKISEAQWVSRLTNHAAATRETLDDVYERANQRVAKEANANPT